MTLTAVTSRCLLVLLVFGLGGCSSDGATTNDERVPTAPAASEPAPAEKGAAPKVYQVKFETTKGDFVVQVDRSWAPRGADRFYQLVKSGFYDDTGFFRVVPGFMVQFGLASDPKVQAKWRERIMDDPVIKSNRKGYITFATSGANSRTTQVFINYEDNNFLDGRGFAPFGQVVEGMDVVESINSEYGERPDQQAITNRGTAYLRQSFPNLDFITRARVISEDGKPVAEEAKSEPAPSDAAGAADEPESPAPEE